MYTNDVEDENYNEGQDVEVSSSGSGNGLKLLIIVILAIVAIGLVVFAISKKKGNSSSNDTYTLSVYPETIIVPVGETQTISYEVKKNNERVPNAQVRLESGDENVVTVENTTIKGVNYGTTALTIVYVNDAGKTIQDIKPVVVASGDPDVKLEKVNFPEGDLQMPINGTYNIELGFEPEKGYVESIKYTPSDTSIITVDNLGKVTALSEGNANITIDVNGTFKKVLKVSVTDKVEISKLVLSPTKIEIKSDLTSIKEGETATLTYTLTPENSVCTVKWSSSDTSILTVDDNGKINGVKEGSAIIKATTSNELEASIKIEVVKNSVEPTDISIEQTELSLEVGGTTKLMPTLIPAETTEKTLTYESSDTGVVSVKVNEDMSAELTAVAAGTATIKIKTSNEIEKTVTVTVTEASSESEPSGGGSSGGSGGSSSGGSSGGNCSPICAAGKYCSGKKCVTCPAGYRCSNNKKTKCPTNTTSQQGASYCTATSCPIGQGAGDPSISPCSACGKGSYSDDTSINCKKCPDGYTTKGTGAKSLSECNVLVSSLCPANTYKNSSGGCSNCPTGYKSSKGSEGINSCYYYISAGYSLAARSTTPVKCSAGYYSSGSILVHFGSSHSCTKCPTGYTSAAGATSAGKCYKTIRAGTELAAKSATATLCKKGYWSSKSGAVYYGSSHSCSSCSPGYTTAGRGATSHLSCIKES